MVETTHAFDETTKQACIEGAHKAMAECFFAERHPISRTIVTKYPDLAVPVPNTPSFTKDPLTDIPRSERIEPIAGPQTHVTVAHSGDWIVTFGYGPETKTLAIFAHAAP